MAGRSKPGKIHLRIIKVMKRFPGGISGGQIKRLRLFRGSFSEFEQILPSLVDSMPTLLTKLYVDCQAFAEREMEALLDQFEKARNNKS